MKRENSTVLLENGTVGTIQANSIDFQNPENFIGEVVRVQLQDENGGTIETEGKLIEVLI